MILFVFVFVFVFFPIYNFQDTQFPEWRSGLACHLDSLKQQWRFQMQTDKTVFPDRSRRTFVEEVGLTNAFVVCVSRPLINH